MLQYVHGCGWMKAIQTKLHRYTYAGKCIARTCKMNIRKIYCECAENDENYFHFVIAVEV